MSWLRRLFARRRMEIDLDKELRFHFESQVADKVRSGVTRREARRLTRLEFGGIDQIKEECRTSRGTLWLESIVQDVHYGLRQIMRSPGLSIVAILSLALGIGANTAIFTVIDDLLLKQLPVHNPKMLVSFGDGSDAGIMASSSPGPYDIFPYDFYRRISGNQKALDGICAFASFTNQVSVRAGSGAQGPATQAISHLVSGSFFSVLGVQPLMGRVLTAEDTAVEGANPVVVISYHYWQENLSADSNVIGRVLTINNTSFMIVGVTPPSFYGVTLSEVTPDLWLPITMQPQVMMRPSLMKLGGLFWIDIMARRKPNVSVAEAQSWATVEFQRFLTEREGAQISGRRQKQISGTFIPLLPGGAGLSDVRQTYQVPLMVLMTMVGVVLLIACANLANLLLAKAASREREFCARLALGSSRGRIVRQILIEALMLALVGGTLGLAVAFWSTRAIIHFIDGGAAYTAFSATPDARVLLFTLAICVVTAILFGIAPGIRGSRTDMSGVLTASARTAGGGAARSHRILPKALIVTQVTLSVVLLTLAGLLLRTLQNLRGKDIGMDRSHVLLVNTNPKFAGYQPERLNALYDRILNRIDALPGVRSASLAGSPPLQYGTWGSPIDLDGRPTPPNENISTLLNRVSTGYFETLGIPLLRGRTIQSLDSANAPKAAVVNQTFADRYFPNRDAIGHTFTIADPEAPGVWHIVGIVRDSKHRDPAEKPEAFAYLATTQLSGEDQYAYWLQVRTDGDPSQLTGEVRGALAEIDPNLPILKTQTIEEQFNGLIDQHAFISELAAVFAALALALACIGLYGVMTYNVVRRMSEFGVRMALGASKGMLIRLVLKESFYLLAIGVLLGIPASLAASQAIRAGLYGVNPTDPLTLAAATLVISACLLFGAYMPARRAAGIDPIAALRYE
ncbi:ADOP family duplicated permease [Acidicapsa dinghuensis]|uniref:ADOP family duplicated permease n=1 Tax=Acidicapsa dinghuensis TaxID=2218256 RepID=A0ABW1EMQ5_9BACT|nr:ABC transporter permease [Acidicapsa dinghuensis]